MRPHYLLLAGLLLSTPALASNERINQAGFASSVTTENSNQVLPLRNTHLLEYLFVDVYSAALYAPADAKLEQLLASNSALRLELYYYRSIKRQDVIKAAWTALERQYDTTTLATLKPSVDQLHASFSDIGSGDRYSLTRTSDQHLVLRHNGQITFESNDRQLADAYLGIWLRPDGLSDELRSALLN